jgi:UDP-N-acetylmuramoyl-tripeptide--D-alanyl-D-alanine ligase
MTPVSLETIARVTDGTLVGGADRRNDTITGVVRDNRDAYAGCLFACIKGANVDGHDYANEAFSAGAICAIAERELENATAPYILVSSTLHALQLLAEYYRGLFDIPVIGVTGSVGKTTAKEMSAAVLSERCDGLKTEKNQNNELGVPLTIFELEPRHTAAVIEMGISRFGEMSVLAEIVRPTICITTTIGYCHLDALGDLDGVLRAKSEVYPYMARDGIAVVYGDDERLRALDPGIRKITFGLGSGNDYRAENVISHGTDCVTCDIVTPTARFPVTIPAFGEHTALAALAAAAVGESLGMTGDEIAAGITRYVPVEGRANVIQANGITVIDDCYNANPNSVKASLKALCALPGRRVAILGDMLELGKDSNELHREVGMYAARQGLDCLICQGEKAEFIYKGMVASKVETIKGYHFPMREALYERLPELIKPGDTVLIKASHSMDFQSIAKRLTDNV